MQAPHRAHGLLVPRPGAPRHGPRARKAAPAPRAAWPLANTMACLPPPSLQVAASLARTASGRGAPWPARAAPRSRPSRAPRKSPGSLRAGCPLPPCASAVQLGLLAELLTELPAHPPARSGREITRARRRGVGVPGGLHAPGPRFRRHRMFGCDVVYMGYRTGLCSKLCGLSLLRFLRCITGSAVLCRTAATPILAAVFVPHAGYRCQRDIGIPSQGPPAQGSRRSEWRATAWSGAW